MNEIRNIINNKRMDKFLLVFITLLILTLGSKTVSANSNTEVDSVEKEVIKTVSYIRSAEPSVFLTQYFKEINYSEIFNEADTSLVVFLNNKAKWEDRK